MIKFDILKKFFSITLKKILVVFAVGFIARIIINNLLDINILKDYCCYLNLGYYAFIGHFIHFIYDLPTISYTSKVLNIRYIANCISHFLFHSYSLITVEGQMGNNLDSSKNINNNNILFTKKHGENYKHNFKTEQSYGKNKSRALGRYTELELHKAGFKSAASRGLYNFESIENKSNNSPKPRAITISNPFNPRGTLLSNNNVSITSRELPVMYDDTVLPKNKSVDNHVSITSRELPIRYDDDAVLPKNKSVDNNRSQSYYSRINNSTKYYPSKINHSYYNTRNVSNNYNTMSIRPHMQDEYSSRNNYNTYRHTSTPRTPVISRLSTPSTMEPLFPETENKSKSYRQQDTTFSGIIEQRKGLVLEAMRNKKVTHSWNVSTEYMVFNINGNKLNLEFNYFDRKCCKIKSIYANISESAKSKVH